MHHYDIFISYKSISKAAASALWYRLKSRGYSTFVDLEDMGRGNYDEQLFHYIENSRDVFIILEEGSLDACKGKNEEWKDDWFCKEIRHALKTKRNIIPICIDDYRMPDEDSLPDELKELSLKHSPKFSFASFEKYLDSLIEKKFITSEPQTQKTESSVFKIYADLDCKVFKEGKLVCELKGLSDEPYYLPISKKGDYRFKCVFTKGKPLFLNSYIDKEEEKILHIKRKNLIEKSNFLYIAISLLVLINVSFVSLYVFNNNNNSTIQESVRKRESSQKPDRYEGINKLLDKTEQVNVSKE